MTIPPEFSETEHFQSVCRRYLNKEIREAFRDLGGDDWEPEVGTTRGSMRQALTHKDNDTLQMTMGRMFLFYFTYGQARALQTPVYGIPITTYQEASLKYKPQINLYFDQSRPEAKKGFSRVTGEISYRLMSETSQSIKESDLKIKANKIKNLFVTPNLFVWHKGKIICKYTDTKNGYKFRLLVTNEAEAKRIIEQVLDIENKTPDWENLTVSESRANFPDIPASEIIYGETRRLPRRRPREDVKFRHATADIWGLPKPIALVDTRFSLGNPLVQVA